MKTHYPMKLEDEFYVTKSNLIKLFEKKKVFAIGYGSLLFANGWDRRGMDVVTQPEDLIECTVKGYKRGPYGIQGGVHFYGTIRDDKSHFNAVLNPIHSWNDWAGLMKTEYIAGMYHEYNYRVVDVTHLIYGTRLNKNAAVHMVANESVNATMGHMFPPAPGYYDYVWRGTKKERSEEFQKEFLKTGGVTNVRKQGNNRKARY